MIRMRSPGRASATRRSPQALRSGKAKALRPYVEKLVTKAKVGGVHKQRQVVATIHDKDVTHKLFVDIGPRYTDRNGGYTRILKLGPRPGDNAPMARIEFV